jgi:carboxy-cis,cis-muconate cyclase
MLGTFRSPYLYTLSFDTKTSKLELLATNDAISGHSWLDVSPDGKSLYTTCWSTPPLVSSYTIIPPSSDTPYPTVKLSSKIASKHLSGYVCSNKKAMYSACGPQVDVFLLDEKTGALKEQEAVQSFALVNESDMHKGNSQLDFGGLRHGGHVSVYSFFCCGSM